jgi:hypothetical protein
MEPEEKKENGKKKTNNKKKKSDHDGLWIVLIFLVYMLVIGLFHSVSTYNDLVLKEQQLKSNESAYGGSVYVAYQQIESVWRVYDTYLSHESGVFKEATKLRAQYYEAAREGNSRATVDAAIAFQSLSVKEAFPQLVSAQLAENTQKNFIESINNMDDSLRAWISDTKNYNVARNQFWGRIVGDYGGLPREYAYYKSEKTVLNVTQILN